jgi:uncharacterized membrane protein
MCGFFVIFLVAVAVLILWVVFRNRPDLRQQVSSVFAEPRAQADPAEKILRGRLARGEIDAEEYERSLRILRG